MHEVNYRPDPRGDFLIAAGTSVPADYVPTPDPAPDTMTSLGLTAGLTAFWKMDEGVVGDRADASGNGRTLTINGSVGSGAGLLNNAALFTNNSDDYLSSASAVFATGVSTITVSCWAKLNTIADRQALLGKFSRAGIADGYRLYYFSEENAFTFQQADSNLAQEDQVVSAQPVSAGVWYHIVAGFDGVNHFIVIDGGARELDDGIAPTTASADFMIGLDGEGLDVLDGLIDEVGIWIGTVLTDQQIAALYNSGTPLAFS